MSGFEAFLTGWANARAQSNIREQDKADEEENRIRGLAQRGMQMAQQRTALATGAKTMADQLLSWGATPDMVQAALGQGQQGLAEFHKTVKGVHQSLGAEEAKRYLNSEDGKYVQLDLGGSQSVGQEGLYGLIERTYGLPTSAVAGDYKAPERSIFGKIFGSQNYKEQMLQDLDAEMGGVGGYSVYDLSTIGTLPDYMPNAGGASITYKQPTIYTTQDFDKEQDNITSFVSRFASQNTDYAVNVKEYEEKSLEFRKQERQIKAIQEDANLTDTQKAEQVSAIMGSDTYKIAKADMELARDAKNEKLIPAITQFAQRQGSQYFNSSRYYEEINDFTMQTYGFKVYSDEQIEDEKAAEEVVKQLGGGSLAEPAAAAGDNLEDTQEDIAPKVEAEYTFKTKSGQDLEVIKVDGVDIVRVPETGATMNEQMSQLMIQAAKSEGENLSPVLSTKGYTPQYEYNEGDAQKAAEVKQAIIDYKQELPPELQEEYDAFIGSDSGSVAFSSILADKPLPEDIQKEIEKFEAEDVPSFTEFFSGFTGIFSKAYEALKGEPKKTTEDMNAMELQGYLNQQAGRPQNGRGKAGPKPTIEPKPEQEYISYEQWQGMSRQEREDLGLPTSKVGVQQITRGGMIALPEGVSSPFTETEVVMPDEPMLDIPSPSEVDTTVASRTDRPMGGLGVMTPTKPSDVTTDAGPSVETAVLEDKLAKVHGEGAKELKTFVNKMYSKSGLKTADVTRIIKATQKLPKTGTRDKVLAELFQLRDSMK